MGLRNLVLVALLALAGVGLASVWNASAGAASRSSSTREGFRENTTDDDIDLFVAVSGAMKRHRGSEPTASEVRRTMGEMRKKRVGVKDVERFVRSRGGRVAVEPLEAEKDAKPSEPDPSEDGPKDEPPEAEAKPVASRKAKKAESDRKTPAVSASVADRLTRELNAIADRVDDLVEEIAKSAQQPMDQPIQASVSEGFANFSSWTAPGLRA